LNVIWLWFGIVAFIIGILYSVQTWRFPDKKYTHKQVLGTRGDSTFMVVLGIVFTAFGVFA